MREDKAGGYDQGVKHMAEGRPDGSMVEAWQEEGWLKGDTTEWKIDWGYLGMVPNSVRPLEWVASNQLQAFKKCTKLTALCLLEMSQAC